MGGKMYTPLGAWYHASKHALEGWSDCLRLELKQFGIHVVVLEPGVIATEFGDVLLEPMLKRSKAGAYADLANALAKALQRSYEQGDSSPTTVISNVVTKIVTSAKPKTRYAVGKHAKPLMWLRKYGGDRIFDKIIMGMAK
jgi:short-subunit dehydrogenase